MIFEDHKICNKLIGPDNLAHCERKVYHDGKCGRVSRDKPADHAIDIERPQSTRDRIRREAANSWRAVGPNDDEILERAQTAEWSDIDPEDIAYQAATSARNRTHADAYRLRVKTLRGLAERIEAYAKDERKDAAQARDNGADDTIERTRAIVWESAARMIRQAIDPDTPIDFEAECKRRGVAAVPTALLVALHDGLTTDSYGFRKAAERILNITAAAEAVQAELNAREVKSLREQAARLNAKADELEGGAR